MDCKLEQRLAKVDGVVERAAAELQESLWGDLGLPDDLVFDDLEDFALELGRRISRRLSSQALARQATRVAAEAPACPGCERQAAAKTAKERQLLTRFGPVEWSEQRAYCPACRRAFSPSTPAARP